FTDPKQAYIWAMAFLPDGDLAIATGVDGKLFRVKPNGDSKVFFDSAETHLRSLAVKNDGTLLVGGSGKGRIYEVKPDGSADETRRAAEFSVIRQRRQRRERRSAEEGRGHRERRGQLLIRRSKLHAVAGRQRRVVQDRSRWLRRGRPQV